MKINITTTDKSELKKLNDIVPSVFKLQLEFVNDKIKNNIAANIPEFRINVNGTEDLFWSLLDKFLQSNKNTIKTSTSFIRNKIPDV